MRQEAVFVKNADRMMTVATFKKTGIEIYGDQSPRFETLVSLAQALGRPVQDLMIDAA